MRELKNDVDTDLIKEFSTYNLPLISPGRDLDPPDKSLLPSKLCKCDLWDKISNKLSVPITFCALCITVRKCTVYTEAELDIPQEHKNTCKGLDFKCNDVGFENTNYSLCATQLMQQFPKLQQVGFR